MSDRSSPISGTRSPPARGLSIKAHADALAGRALRIIRAPPRDRDVALGPGWRLPDARTGARAHAPIAARRRPQRLPVDPPGKGSARHVEARHFEAAASGHD